MVNFGPLAAEIGSGVWGTPANFKGFRVLHGTVVVSVSQTYGVEQTAPPIFGRVAITLGIGPHSSCYIVNSRNNYSSAKVCQKYNKWLK